MNYAPASTYRKLGTSAKSGKRFYGQEVDQDPVRVELPAVFFKDGRMMRPAMTWMKPRPKKMVIHEKVAR